MSTRRGWRPTVGQIGAGGLALWTLVWFLAMHAHGAMAWHFFLRGESILLGPGDGLRVYAVQPQLQIGPLAFLATTGLRPLSPGGGVLAAELLTTALGAAVLLMVRRIARQPGIWPGRSPEARTVDRRLLLAAFAFVPVWMYLAVASLHLDDALALTFAVAALLAALRDRPVLTGLAVAAAVDAKPWALPFVVVVLLLPGLRPRLVSLGVAAAGIAALWLPFFVADPGTLRALHFTIVNRADSTLRVLGVMDPRTPPWDRPAQDLVGALLAGWVIHQRRWAAVPLVVMTARLALDPGTNHYYTAGLAVGAVLWDVCGSRLRWPVWSAAVLVIHLAQSAGDTDRVHGWLVLVFALCVLAFLVVPARRPDQGPDQPSAGEPTDVYAGTPSSSSTVTNA